MAGRLKGKVAIVTGSGMGIGETEAMVLAKEGANIAVVDFDLSLAEKVAGQIRDMGRQAIAIKADVSKKADVDQMVKKTLDTFKNIDILVNNAGVFFPAPAIELTEADWDKNIDVNLKGTFLCCQAVGRHMIKRRQGKIVNTASVSGYRGEPGQAGYAPSKAGVMGLTTLLAVEWGEFNVNVNSVSPSTTLTPMCRQWLTDSGIGVEGNERWIPMNRANETEDIAYAVLFLASEEARNITGQNITVDGGFTAMYWPKGWKTRK